MSVTWAVGLQGSVTGVGYMARTLYFLVLNKLLHLVLSYFILYVISGCVYRV